VHWSGGAAGCDIVTHPAEVTLDTYCWEAVLASIRMLALVLWFPLDAKHLLEAAVVHFSRVFRLQ